MDRPDFHLLPNEIEMQKALFARQPLSIVDALLQCFDTDGNQRYEIPKHVAEALVSRLRAVMADEHTADSLDKAFGGRIARQRNAILEQDRRADIVFQHIVLQQALKKQADGQDAGTPYEIATEKLAEELRMSEGNIQRLLKEAGKK